jgi:hypothetical protein
MPTQRKDGGIEVSLLDETIIECRARGHLCLDHVLAAQAEIERLARVIVGTVDSLYDGAAIESFEPGLPIRWVRWGGVHRERPRRVAIVARPGPMTAVARTFRVLMPTMRLAIFTDRAAALAFLRAANDGDVRGGR